jgi:hypothetical protein
MKRILLSALGAMAIGLAAQAQTRYLDEVFPNVDFTFGTVYGQNFHFIPLHDSPLDPTVPPGPIPPLGYTPTVGPMTLDVYQPNGDTETERPLVIVVHTGNFLPRYINRGTTGDKGDSAIVEISRRFAKRGFVAAAPRYRLGWNPTSSDQITRTRTLLVAVYRAVHDIQTAVRFFKANAATYKINPNKIILVGLGSGGYITNTYATLDRYAETVLEKFQDDFGNSVVDTAIWGNVNGVGGTWNQYNHAGFDNSVSMVINLGGALGDASWLEGGEVPMVGFHCWKDLFAPYDSGNVYVPTTGDLVVGEVIGTRKMIKKAVALGNNDIMLNAIYNDPVSLRGYSLNPKAQYEGLFEFRTPPLPGGLEEGSPWDWWDSTTVVSSSAILGLPTSGTGPNGNPNNLHLAGLLTNPNMSAAKGRAYIDTVMRYSCPRIYNCVILGSSNIVESGLDKVSLFPNPVTTHFTITTNGVMVRSVNVVDFNGRIVAAYNNLNSTMPVLERGTLAPGTYIVRVNTTAGVFNRKVIFR